MGSSQSSSGLESSKVRPVIGLTKDTPKYNLHEVEHIFKNGPAQKSTEVFVICISGDYRSGKSFLLNLLVTYMAYYCAYGSDDGWTEAKDTEIKGGKWAAGEDAVTKGIWMFMFPKLINGKAIILMDCQGSKDTMYSSPTLDNLILFLGLQLSDVHMLNVTTTIKATDYDRLDLCVYHADSEETDDEQSEALFERHIFLVRDWGNPTKPKSIDQVIQQTQSESMRKAALGIKQAFRVVENEALPHPGEGVIGTAESASLTIGAVSPRFLREVRPLFHKLTVELPVESTRNCEDFMTQFEFVSRRSVGKISTPQEAHEESLIKLVFKETSTHFNTEIAKLEGQKHSLTEQQMEERITAAYDKAKEMFTSNKRVQKCEHQHLADDYLGYLKSTYKECLFVLGRACVVERLTKEVEKRKKSEEVFKQRLRILEEESRRAQEHVQQLEYENKQTNALKETLVAKESLKAAQKLADEKEQLRKEHAEETRKAAQKIADEKEELRREQARRVEEAIAEKERVVRERQEKAEELEERLRNPPIGDAVLAFGKSVINNTFGRLFNFSL